MIKKFNIPKIMALFFTIAIIITGKCFASEEYDRYIIKYKDGFSPVFLSSTYDNSNEIVKYDIKQNILVTKSEQFAESAEKSQYVEYVEPDYIVTLDDYTVTDAYYNRTGKNDYNWPQKMTNCKSAWDKGLFGMNVRIGVIDSGIAEKSNKLTEEIYNLPDNYSDFFSNINGGFNFYNNSNDLKDNMGHGTAIAQIIASQNNNDFFIGTAPRAKIVPLKIFELSTVYTSDIASVINSVIDNPEYKCDILNMSFTTNNNQTLENAINRAYQNGIIMIAAVGNYKDGDEIPREQIMYPAGYDAIIGVGSVDKDKNVSKFSHTNSSVFCVAPGEGVYAYSYYKNSQTVNWKLSTMKGTSFSAPQVAGLAALLKGINPNLTGDEFKEIIINTAVPLGENDYDTTYGYGLIDVNAAIEYMLNQTSTFVSPIYNDYLDTSITVTNNTDTAQDYVSVWSSDSTDGIKLNRYTVSPFSSVTIPYSFDKTYLKHMLFSGTNSIKPLYKDITAERITE